MKQRLLVSSLDEQRRKVLIDLTEKALLDSSSLISMLGRKPVLFQVDSVYRCCMNGLDEVFDAYESDMVAVCQRLDMSKTGHIMFMLADESAIILTKLLLSERHQLKEMTEMEEESLTEIGNIIINNCLRNFIKIFHETVSGLIPTFARGHYADLVNILISDSQGDKDIYLVKISIEIGGKSFTGYILWLGHLCQLSHGLSKPNTCSSEQDNPR